MVDPPVTEANEGLNDYRDAIYRYILGIMRNPVEADDLTQETLLRAHQKLATLKDRTKLKPWLYRIATHLCYDRFRDTTARKQQPLDGHEDQNCVPEPTAPSPPLGKQLEQREMSDCVQEYIARLPDTHRAVIILHDAEGMTNPEIARMLGVTLATVKIRLHRARARLREMLDAACSFSDDESGTLTCDRKPRDNSR